MANRHRVNHRILNATISFKVAFGMIMVLCNLVICCPDCGSTDVSRNGTRPRAYGRVDAFICKNAACFKSRGKPTARQFTVLTSGRIAAFIDREITDMIDALYRRGAKAKTVAAEHGVSDAFVSLLRSAVDETITKGKKRDRLVSKSTKDHAVSIDETFFKIDGKTVYAIIVRGYRSSKVLGINVSRSRAEADIRKAFDEAQVNSSKRIEVITADALEATRAMARHFGYPITLVVHPHKKPYKKAIIERIEYDGNMQVHTLIGVKVDVFKKRGKRQYMYKQVTRPVQPPAPKPRGRPKGSKNKPKGHPVAKKPSKKRGRASIFDVFTNGCKGYVKVRPRLPGITFQGMPIQPVVKGVRDAFELFAGKCIQNNHSETVNNTFRTVTNLGGQRTVAKLSGRLRAVARLRNEPKLKPGGMPRYRRGASIILKKMIGLDFKADFSNCSIKVEA